MSCDSQLCTLNQARFRAVASNLPALHVALSLNVCAITLVFVPLAPVWLLLPPVVLSLSYALVRGRYWARVSKQTLSDEEAAHALHRAKLLLIGVSIVSTSWYLALGAYSTDKALGLLMVSSGGLMVVALFGVIHVRTGAFVMAGMAFLTLTVFTLSAGLNAVGVIVVIGVGMVCLVKISLGYARSFDDLVLSKSELVRRGLETQRLSDENFHLANTDTLTGIGNRRHFFSDLAKAMAGARAGQTAMAIGIVDLNGFRAINDSNGHLTGDRLLAVVAHRLIDALEGCGETYRLGGDEFAIILPGENDEARLMALGDYLIEVVGAPIDLGDLRLIVGCTVGFACRSDLTKDSETLYEHADYALHHAKKSGRMRTAVFSDAHARIVRENALIERTLRAADLEEELYLTFQPIVSSRANCTLVFECLARWQSSALGFVSPGKFIVIAEQSGLISMLTPILLRKALAAAKCWPESIGISFNLSGHDISSPQNVLNLIRIVQQSGVNPRRIDFEVTETAVSLNLDQAIANLNRLKALGSQISLDDFGTGYSSLSKIQKLPLDKIKVDGSFVRDLLESEASQKIVRSVSALSRDLNLKCVIEGVETREQLELLNGFGCDLIQGYYYAKPMRDNEVAGFLAAQAGEPTSAAAAG